MTLTTDHPLTMSVPEAGRILGLGRDAAYAAARAGQIPVIRIGRLIRVPITALERMLAEAGKSSEAA
jgi:excisionase family DNA binding protein